MIKINYFISIFEHRIKHREPYEDERWRTLLQTWKYFYILPFLFLDSNDQHFKLSSKVKNIFCICTIPYRITWNFTWFLKIKWSTLIIRWKIFFPTLSEKYWQNSIKISPNCYYHIFIDFKLGHPKKIQYPTWWR